MVKTRDVAKAAVEKIPQPYAEVGSTGLKQYGGRIDDEFLTSLKGAKGRKLFREMSENEPIIAAALGTIKQVLRSVDVRVTEADSSQEAMRAAELVSTGLHDMSLTWADTLTEELSALVYGWAAQETVYKRREGAQRDPGRNSKHTDGLIGWRKHASRAQESLDRWELDEEGGVQGMWQSATYTTAQSKSPVVIPISKMLLFRTEAYKGSPEGKSVLRGAYVPYHGLKHIRWIEGVGIERDLNGYPIMRLPSAVCDTNATGDAATAHTEYKTIIRNIRRDEQESLMLPSERDASGNYLYDLQLLSVASRRQFDLNATIQRLQREIALALLCDFILLGHEKVGSFSLASSKTGIFTLAIAGWLDSIIEVWNRYAIPRLIGLNGWDLRLCPTLTHGDIETPDLAELGAYISSLAGAGFNLFAQPGLEEYLTSLAGWTGGEDAVVGKREWKAARLATLKEQRRKRGA